MSGFSTAGGGRSPPLEPSSNGAGSASAAGAAQNSSAAGNVSKNANAAATAGLDEDDEMGSGSEHNTEQPYGAGGDGDEPDVHHALTTQTLNSDGTPKRPMNAFMIFARRRRPQVSAANQMMRTGEISKILSKEWNSMPMHEKQFYLDQAKKLKDHFNSKYPDYVYRRRPNNSRRKRRADSSVGARFPESGQSAGGAGVGGPGGEHHDDGSGSTEFSGESPVDVPTLPHLGLADAHHSHHHHHNPHGLAAVQQPTHGQAQQQQQPGPPPHLVSHHHPQIYTRPLYPQSDQTQHQQQTHPGLSPSYDAGPQSASSHSSTSSYHGYGGYGAGDEQLSAYPGSASSALSRPTIPWSDTSPSAHAHGGAHGHHPHSPGLEPLHAHHAPYDTHSLHAHSPEETTSGGGPGHGHGGHGSLWAGITSARFDPARTPNASVSAGAAPGTHSGWPMPPSLASVSAQQAASGRPRSLTGSTAIGGTGAVGHGGAGGGKSELISPPIPHRAWSNTPSSGSSASATSTAGVTTAIGSGVGVGGMQFSTLTAPFFPGSSSSSSGAPGAGGDNRSTSTSPTLARDPYYTSAPGSGAGGPGGRGDDAYDTSAPHSAYPISPISPPSGGSYFSSGAGAGGGPGNGTAASLYPNARGPHLPHPISTYNVPGQRDLASPLSAGPPSGVSHAGYWDRINDGR